MAVAHEWVIWTAWATSYEQADSTVKTSLACTSDYALCIGVKLRAASVLLRLPITSAVPTPYGVRMKVSWVVGV